MFRRDNRGWLLLALMAWLWAALIPSLALGDFVVYGNVVPTDPSTWVGGYLGTTGYIGNTASGTLTVNNASHLFCSSAEIGFSSAATGVLNISGAGTTWSNDGFNVGVSGTGVFSVTGGGSVSQVSNGGTNIGCNAGSHGSVTVSDPGSQWGTMGVYVGCDGDGSLSILNGGSVSAGGVIVGSEGGSKGVVTIDGTNSILDLTNSVEVGGVTSYGSGHGNGTLDIRNGGTLVSRTVNPSYIGTDATSVGVVKVRDQGSSFTLTSSYLFVGGSGTGTLLAMGGGTVTAHGSLSVNSTSLLATDVGCGSLVNVATLWPTYFFGRFINNGTVRIMAGATPAANGVFTPITATSYSGSGTYQAIGGSWSTLNHQFTASAVLAGVSGQPLNIDLASTQRISVVDDATGWGVGASFLDKDSSTPLGFTATAASGAALTSLQSQLYPGNTVLGGWLFSADSGYTPGDPAYLSFEIGPQFSRDDLKVWHYDGSSWTPYDATDLTCNGGYASFTVTGFSGYAVTVPEPSAFVLLLVAAIGVFARAWTSRRSNR